MGDYDDGSASGFGTDGGEVAGSWQPGDSIDTDPSGYAGSFSGTSTGTGWETESGAVVGADPNAASAPPERGASYAERDLTGERWEHRIFERCSFAGAKLVRLSTSNCTFVQCEFSAADLSYSIHERSAFVSCTFRDMTLTSAQFKECKLAGSLFESVELGAVVITGGDLTSVSLVGANLSGADLSEVRFYGADLTQTDFTGATFAGADLRGVTLNDTNFENADLQGALFGDFDAGLARLTGARVDPEQAVELARATFGVVVG
jgi:uncharacterized protein YjbI with pentapeptide repeats